MRYFFKLFFIFFFLSSYAVAAKLIIEPDAGRAPLLSAINNAKSSVDLVMYGLTDESFITALIQAKNSGKKINILLEPEPYKSENENARAIRTLRSENISLYWPDKKFKLVHQKTFLFDNQTAIVMTFNLTHSSFSRERNFALILTDPSEVSEIKRVFDADRMQKNVTVSDPHLLWSPDNSREKILQLIEGAHSEIKIYAQDITDYTIIGTLAKMARKGIDVKIILSITPEKLRSKKFAFLKKAGVVVHNSQHYYIHAKVIIVDQKRAILGSINFTKPSLNDNRELSVLTEQTDIVNQLMNTFDKDWRDTNKIRYRQNQSWPTKRLLQQVNRFYYHARHAWANGF